MPEKLCQSKSTITDTAEEKICTQTNIVQTACASKTRWK